MTDASAGPLAPSSAAGSATRSALRTPRAAAIAGIVFSALLITALTLLRVSAPGIRPWPGGG